MITHCRIEEIKVGPRFRKRLGNVEAFARSIEDVGLLHAIVIDQNFNLVAGRRRLEALSLLIAKGAEGWKQVPVRQVNLDDLLGAEHDENVHRLDYAPSEAVAIAEALEERLSEQAKARQLSGLRQGQESPVVPNWPDGESPGRTRDLLAACVGMGRTNLGKARAVVEAARRDPERYGDLVERMDETRLVDPAYKELTKRAEQAVAERQQAIYSQPGPDDPYPDPEHRAYQDIRVCSADELLASLDHCVDAIVTEPPSRDDRAKVQQLYADLAHLSKTALKPVGVLAVLSRDQDLAALMAAVTPHLQYVRTIPILTAAGGKAFTWRPVVVFGAEWGRITPAMTIRREADDDRNGIFDLVELLTKPLQLVADPFMGDSTGIVKIGRTLVHPVKYACIGLDRSFVAADPDGLFQGSFRMMDLDRLREMVEELRAAEPGRRIPIWDGPKIDKWIAEPSTYPAWLGVSKSHRTRERADRIIRLVEMYLNERPMFTGNDPCPPWCVRISRDDRALLDDVLELASSPLDEAYLSELLHDDDEAPNGPVGDAAASGGPADTDI